RYDVRPLLRATLPSSRKERRTQQETGRCRKTANEVVMGFSGTLTGLLRGKPHYFQMEWVDLDQGFESVDSGYNTIEGGKPYIVFISEEQMKLFDEHPSLRVRVMAL